MVIVSSDIDNFIDNTMNEEFTLKVEIVELKNEEDFSYQGNDCGSPSNEFDECRGLKI